MRLLTQVGSLVCEVSSFLELALPRREDRHSFFHRSQSAARPCERGAGNRRGGGQLRWAMVALARAIIALELACSSSAMTLPGGSQFKSIRCGTQNDHPWALSVDKSRLLAS